MTSHAAMPVELVLVRHASPELSPIMVAGRWDPPLQPDGRLQAEALAERLHDLKVASVRTSPLRRANQTAEILARAVGVEAVTEPDLAEYFRGELELFDPAAPDWAERFDPHWQHGRWSAWPGGERRIDFRQRLRAVRARLAARGGRHVLVTHGGVINEILCDLLGLGFITCFHPAPTAVSIIRINLDDVSFVSFNDTYHLDDPLTALPLLGGRYLANPVTAGSTSPEPAQ